MKGQNGRAMVDLLLISSSSRLRPYFKWLKENLDLKVQSINKLPSRAEDGKNTLFDSEVDDGIMFNLEKRMSFLSSKNVFIIAIYRSILRVLYSLRFRRIFCSYYAFLKDYEVRAIVVWNGERLYERAAILAAKKHGVKCLFFENGLLPRTTTIDSKGVNAKNSIPRYAQDYYQLNVQHVDESDWNKSIVAREEDSTKKSNKLSQQGVSNRTLPSSYFFVPFQVFNDSQILLNSPALKTMRELYRWLELLCESKPGLHFVVKEHPSCSMAYEDLYNKHPQITFVKKDTETLIQKAKAVVTINSTVGLESLLLNKPVVVLGDACFAIDGLTLPCRDWESFCKAVNNINANQWRPEKELRQRFLYYLYNCYLIQGSWRDRGDEHLVSVKKRISDLIFVN